MNKFEKAKLLFAKLEKLSKQANMSVREYILEKGTVEEMSADSWRSYAWNSKLFTMQDMSYMVFYIQPKWGDKIVMILDGYYGYSDGGDVEEKINYAQWMEVERKLEPSPLGPAYGYTVDTVYNIEFETTTADDRWYAHNDWIYLNLNDVIVNSSFLNWKFNPLEVTE